MYKIQKKKNKHLNKIVIIIILIGLLFVLENIYWESQIKNDFKPLLQELQQQNKAIMYNLCLSVPYQSDQTNLLFSTLISTLNSNSISIYFEDLNNHYVLSFNENKSYYGASITKLFMASYLIDSAKEGLINLAETITYTNNYKNMASSKLKKHSVGENISISTLLDYSISTSDNAAYAMLANYVGVDNFKKYVKNTFNINLTINSNNLYSYLNVVDTNILLHHIYDIINSNDEYSILLKNAMNNTNYNGLNFDNVAFLHKYGYYSNNYHNIGILDRENPYFISIFSLYGNKDESHLTMVSEISKEIYNIYQTNLTEKENYCYNLAYNQ